MNINKELERAVKERNLDEIKSLLSAGANANHQVEWNRDTLLHITNSVEIARELLLHGAAVNARNMYNETPLHYAITQERKLELVRELLKHGADVNATNRKGNTALNHAVKKSPIYVEVVKELLEHGADINIRNREDRLYEYYSSSLDNAVVRDLTCAKLLIKITLIRNFNKNYGKIVDLSPYKDHRNYQELSSYMNDCVCEIRKMKTVIIDNNVSLCEIITTKETNGDVLYTMNAEGIKSIKNKVFQVLTNTSYPIYHDDILCKIAPSLERAGLLKKLSEVKVYTSLDVSDNTQDVKEKCIVLDPYSKDEVAQYLSDNDLLNIILAYYRCTDQPLCLAENFTASSKQSNTEFCEASTSNYAKRARLE